MDSLAGKLQLARPTCVLRTLEPVAGTPSGDGTAYTSRIRSVRSHFGSMVLPTPEVVKAAFSGNPDKKAGWVSKTEAVNAKFQLNLPVDGTVTDLKDRLKDAKENLLRKVRTCAPFAR